MSTPSSFSCGTKNSTAVMSDTSYHKPKKRFGQHFLVNSRIAEKIVGSAGILPGDEVLEIGPGKGILTGYLLEKGAKITAVEIDHSLADYLRERFGDYSGFTLIEGDILKLNLTEVFKNTTGGVKVVSNLPYNISTPVLELLCRSRAVISEAVLMVQREVARRILASPGTKDYGLTTINLAMCARGRSLMDVKPGAFSPPPAVMSKVISLSFRREFLYPLKNERVFWDLTGALFRQRRKMLRNTLIPYLNSLGFDDGVCSGIAAEAGIELEARPETVDVGRFVALSNAVAARLDRT